jgi:hypothetical protein
MNHPPMTVSDVAVGIARLEVFRIPLRLQHYALDHYLSRQFDAASPRPHLSHVKAGARKSDEELRSDDQLRVSERRGQRYKASRIKGCRLNPEARRGEVTEIGHPRQYGVSNRAQNADFYQLKESGRTAMDYDLGKPR